MEELDRKINLWIRERLIPQLAEDEPDAEFTIARPSEAFFVSDLFFLTVCLVKSGNKSVVVKLPSQNPELTDQVDYDELFSNEILLYNQIAHVYDDNYPKCYLAGEDPIFKSVIVLEDVRPRGYTVSSKKVDVDLDYIVAGLKSIGKFHGHTYAIKEKEPARFSEVVSSIRNNRFKRDPINEEYKNFTNDSAQRVSRALQAKCRDLEFTAAICELFEDAFTNILMKFAEPVEPLATIVHGDCTINNLLYRKVKDPSDNEQLKSMLIDFGLIMYSSPATDIAVFLYMTCKREDIRDRIEELLSVYHESLVECMKDHEIWDSTKYSRDAFWQEYRKCAIYGYVGAAVFFRHVMMIYERDNVIPEFTDELHDEFFASPEGEDYMDLLLGMLDDLRVAGMLDHVLKK